MTARLAVLALVPLPDTTLDALRRDYVLHYHPDGMPADLADAGTIRAVVTNGTCGLDDVRMARLPALEIVCAFGAGYENVDAAAAARRGIVVTHAPGTNAATVADHAIGMLLALARGYAPLTGAVQAGRWHASRAARPTLAGAALGVIGMGRIGRLVAARAQGFDMTLGYHARGPHGDAPGRYYADLVQLAADSDFLVIACHGGPATRHLVDRAVLRALGPHGYVVNVARGSVLDTAALLDALDAGELAGAGLDVLEHEPDVPAALFDHPDVLVTPHVAGRSPAAWLAQRDALLASLAQHFSRLPVEFAVRAA
ncbi:MAG: 2-hydroxyacid dehydrogenase [Burkholderia sp.]|nr:2-hydroxyacid dehydrogenase [Burkholderia arboris]MCA3782079.1 2-hydroxyacid dehydrogenase [Burkholderia sp.]MCA3788625.1 2-hydroxyacid dehydrogenase [Burkholderia sp.]MCA3793262.1 2-hydroxyacid dehydrogenase [Burkholderia sp.]MCA3800412.1 2-hydroxyacid dehydrogenase [Burkholderia sp.]